MRLVAIPLTLAGAKLEAPPPGHVRRKLRGETMGTVWTADFYAGSQRVDEEFLGAVGDALAGMVREMSHWRPDSDLSRFNRAAAGTWVEVPDDLRRVLAFGMEVAEETDGAFDPAIGRLVNAWGFGPDGADGEGIAGSRHLKLEGTRAWQAGGLSLDFSAFAKGFAVDRLALLLEEMGVRSYLVEIGGEFRGAGVKTGGEPWWVSVERPPEESGLEGFPEVLVAACGLSIATSGDYRRYFTHEGVRYSHTIDPRSGAPLSSDLASVTVLDPECMRADAYSTALSVMGVEEGLAFADRKKLAALFVTRGPHAYEHRASAALIPMLD